MMRKGSVLMEAVIVLPVLLALIFAVAQFAILWQAQMMVEYAAYNAARAALVYHPSRYSDGKKFYATKGVCHAAALRSLKGITEDSLLTKDTVRIVPEESVEGLGKDRNIPAVKVTVQFDCPAMLLPAMGGILAVNDPAAKASSPETHKTTNLPYVTLTGSAVLPKPWKTEPYPKEWGAGL